MPHIIKTALIQCDQMVIFFQDVAIDNNENLPSGIIIVQQLSWRLKNLSSSIRV